MARETHNKEWVSSPSEIYLRFLLMLHISEKAHKKLLSGPKKQFINKLRLYH